MNCVCCGSEAVTERPELTARGYRRFRCRDCCRQFNERSVGVLNRTCLPSDVIAFVVFCRLRYRLTLRDLSEILLLRGIDVSHRDGNLTDAMLSEHRDMVAAKALFRSAKGTMGFPPDRVTTDGHGSYPRAIPTTLGRTVRHRTSAYLNNRLEQDDRGIKGRIRCMRGLQVRPGRRSLLQRAWRTP